MPPGEINKDAIELDEAQFREFYDTLGSSHFKNQGRVLEDLGTKQLDIYFKSLGFVTTVTSVIGIIAGFGFTALNHVQSLGLFFVGEGLLLSSLFYGLFWTQQQYQAEFRSLETERRKHIAFHERRTEKFLALFNGWMSSQTLSRSGLKELNKMDNESIELFKTEKDGPVPSIYSPTMYGLMIAGTVTLFGSFFVVGILRFFLFGLLRFH